MSSTDLGTRPGGTDGVLVLLFVSGRPSTFTNRYPVFPPQQLHCTPFYCTSPKMTSSSLEPVQKPYRSQIENGKSSAAMEQPWTRTGHRHRGTGPARAGRQVLRAPRGPRHIPDVLCPFPATCTENATEKQSVAEIGGHIAGGRMRHSVLPCDNTCLRNGLTSGLSGPLAPGDGRRSVTCDCLLYLLSISPVTQKGRQVGNTRGIVFATR